MNRRASIANLIHDIQERSPAGFAVALHVRFASGKFTIQTYPVEWTEEYSLRGYILHDPVVKWAFSNTGTIRWRDLADLDAKRIMDSARRYGMRYGVTIAHVADGVRSMAGCSRSDREYLDVEIEELQSLVVRLHAETSTLSDLSPQDVDSLRRMSVRLTRG